MPDKMGGDMYNGGIKASAIDAVCEKRKPNIFKSAAVYKVLNTANNSDCTQ